MSKSTRWIAALGAAGALAGGGAALASVPEPVVAAAGVPAVTTSSGVATRGVAAQAQQLAAEVAGLQRAIGSARAQLTQLADQKGGQLAAEQTSLHSESTQLATEHAQLAAEAQQLAAEHDQLQQEAAALAAEQASLASPPSVHTTTGASGGDSSGGDSSSGDD